MQRSASSLLQIGPTGTIGGQIYCDLSIFLGEVPFTLSTEYLTRQLFRLDYDVRSDLLEVEMDANFVRVYLAGL